MCDGAVLDGQAKDIALVWVLAEAADTDAVSWAAGDTRDVHVSGVRADGDAVVTGADVGVGDGDIVCTTTHMDPVGVGAVFRGDDVDMVQLYVVG